MPFLTREMRFWDPLGARQSFTLGDFFYVIAHPRFFLFAGLTLTLFFATDPSSNRDYVPLWASAAIWPMAYIVYLSIYACWLCLQCTATKWLPGLRVPTSLIGIVVLTPTVYVSEEVLLDVMSNGTYPQSLGGNYIFYFLSVQVSEALFFKFIFPNIKLPSQRTTDAQDPDEKVVIVGGERIALRDVHLIEARQHHVQITMSAGTATYRARLGDIVAQTEPSDGIQTHRTWWVPRHSATRLDSEDGRVVLMVNGDRAIPVARTRIGEVQTWVAEHLPKVDRTDTAAE